MLRALIEGCGTDAADPSVLMTHLNAEFTKILRQTGTVLFATAFYSVLDSDQGELRYARAGHPYPFHVQRRAGTVAPFPGIEGATGPALGLLDSASYGNSRVLLEPGDWVLLFTDGWIGCWPRLTGLRAANPLWTTSVWSPPSCRCGLRLTCD